MKAHLSPMGRHPWLCSPRGVTAAQSLGGAPPGARKARAHVHVFLAQGGVIWAHSNPAAQVSSVRPGVWVRFVGSVLRACSAQVESVF